MDRNTITGLVVIALILIGYSYFMSPSKEELKAMHVRDSIARVEAQRAAALEKERQADFAAQQQNTETQQAGTEAIFKQDSLPVEQYTLENNKIKLHINTKGGCIDYVDLKGYRTHDSLPLILWKDHKSSMGLNFYARNKQINTADLIFVPNTNQKELNAEGAEQVLTMRAYVDENKYLEFEYKLAPDSYMVDFNINTYNLNDVIASNTNFLTLYWGVDMPQLEKSRDFESRYTGVYYNFSNNDVEHLSLTGDEKVDLPTSVKWVAYKQQFFSSVLIANESFPNVLVSTANNTTPGFLKTADAEISLPYSGKAIEKYDMRFYFGPNSYPTLREYGKDIELPKLVDLGWKWIAWFNRYVVIPIFNFLETNVTLNYGLIIFLLTLIIKLVLFPLTYKSYMSQAKMRVLKPQIDEINKKIPADKAMERQQAVMKLYKKAGVNPMGGCLPMLLQMPILIALFYFFPGAIELRQKSFLWATDLASYDSIATLPFTIPFYGNHVSLFCLLMTITNILYMWYNSKNQPQNDQMKGMQTMMYIMPIMFLFIFNSYSSGLSYYYFIATLITIVQTWAIRKFVNDEKLLKQIELAKTKPVKKSKFQQKLEEMQRMQEQRMKQMPKKK
ncbi:membrane protein insertase YidC [Butyricimonas virosa]|uniref:Membrane protein insertase YidC n=1 Tax=Butyricimonas virosa TaxID=544645 RepID=A0A412WV93_9BACT|nr:membrane protein insertase YidC [Butyricimonas virosa]MBR5461499.1 membrane protein insertase YidC [Butyricimonas sp.]MCI7391148.1 membrane protein insertase YidC [Butyricimonas virosa]MDY4904988.1 membrane protein insertase YidC [Butyricimonas virosa]RGV31230.1 membrane protein insertase YidC [Butyricimonas virosa]